jgi:general stress protein CsbA
LERNLTRETTTNRIFFVLLNVLCFAATIWGTFQTFFLLSIPVILITIPTAIFAKSHKVKWVAVSCLMGIVVPVLIFLIQAYMK